MDRPCGICKKMVGSLEPEPYCDPCKELMRVTGFRPKSLREQKQLEDLRSMREASRIR